MNRLFSVLGLSAVGVSLIALSSIERDPKILYNPSPSAAIGWYEITPVDEFLVGDLVAAWLPKEAESTASARGYLPANTPIIKTIVARPGGVFCIENELLKIVDQPDRPIHVTDGQGREMPVLLDGCRSLGEWEYLIVSDHIDNSFDSRYFGPVIRSDIIGKAGYLGLVEGLEPSEVFGQGGARGMGAQGKIKGHGTNGPLSHCLHIDFYGTNEKRLVPENGLICNEYGAMQEYQFPIGPGHSRGPKR